MSKEKILMAGPMIKRKYRHVMITYKRNMENSNVEWSAHELLGLPHELNVFIDILGEIGMKEQVVEFWQKLKMNYHGRYKVLGRCPDLGYSSCQGDIKRLPDKEAIELINIIKTAYEQALRELSNRLPLLEAEA